MSLTALDVTLRGGWVPSIEPNLRWAGEIRANGQFATLLIVSTPDRTHWAKAEIGPLEGLPVILDLHPVDADGRQTQFIFFVGNGVIHQVQLLRGSPAYQPEVADLHDLRAGTVHAVFRARTEPTAIFSVLVLSRSDVKVGRSGVWRPRAATVLDVTRNIHIALSGPRTGVVEAKAA